MTDLIYNRRLEEAKELLKKILETLENVADEFPIGIEEIRSEIDVFLEAK